MNNNLFDKPLATNIGQGSLFGAPKTLFGGQGAQPVLSTAFPQVPEGPQMHQPAFLGLPSSHVGGSSLFGGGLTGGLFGQAQNFMQQSPHPWTQGTLSQIQMKKHLTDEEKMEVVSNIQPIPSTFFTNATKATSQALVSGVPIELQYNSDLEEKKVKFEDDFEEIEDVNPTTQQDSLSNFVFFLTDKGQDAEISASRLSVNFKNNQDLNPPNDQSQPGIKQGENFNMVVGSMSFSYGVHTWEIQTPQVSSSMELGVLNHQTQTLCVKSFEEVKGPSTIQITLDLQKRTVQFVQKAENFQQISTLSLESQSGKWVPCFINKGQGCCQLTLNPCVSQPLFQITLNDWLISHLQDMICYTYFEISGEPQTVPIYDKADVLRKLDKNLTKLENVPGERKVCFVQFRGQVSKFVERNKNICKIYFEHEIAAWFLNQEKLNDTEKDLYNIISKHVFVPSSIGQDSTSQDNQLQLQIIQSFSEVSLLKQTQQISSDQQQHQLIYQDFTDKLLAIRGQSMQVLSRKDRYEPFDCNLIDFEKPLQKLSDSIHLRLELKYLEAFFSVFKDNNYLNEANYLIKSFANLFFKTLSKSAINIENKVISFSVPLDQGWFFLNYVFTRVQQDGDNILWSYIFSDLIEQIWCKAKASTVNPQISSFVNSVSRPWSAFNRLGSFICWERPYGEEERDHYKRLADEGYIFDEFTKTTRLVNSGLGNVPLINTLNYLSRFEFSNQLNDIIVSPNSGFALIGFSDGSVKIINTTLPSHLPLKTINFFPNSDEKERRKIIANKINNIKAQMEKLMGKNFSKVSQDFNNSISKDESNNLQEILQSSDSSNYDEITQSIFQKQKIQNEDAFNKYLKDLQKNSTFPPSIIDASLKNALQISENSSYSDKKISNLPKRKIIGYILIDQAQVKQSMDPFYVGCIYFKIKTQKYYLNVIRICWSLPFLHNFISFDHQQSKLVQNKLNAKPFINSKSIEEIHQEILDQWSFQFQELSAIFTQRNSSVSIFNDYQFKKIEIEQCKRIVDFSHCEYENTVSLSKNFNILIERVDGQQVFEQYSFTDSNKVDDYFNYQQSHFRKSHILRRDKTQLLNQKFCRVISYQNKILLIGENHYQQLKFQSISKIKKSSNYQDDKIKLLPSQVKNLEFCNFTPLKSRITLSNLYKGQILLSQDWFFVINNEHKIKISDNEERFFNQGEIKLIDLYDLSTIDDILNLPNLLKTVPSGIKCLENDQTSLLTSGFDKITNLPLKATWNVIKPVSCPLTFEAQLLLGTPVNKLYLEFMITDENFPKVIIESKDINFGIFTVPQTGVLILSNLPVKLLSDIKIKVADCMNLRSLTISGYVNQQPNFLNLNLNSRKDQIRLMLLELERFDEFISKIVSIGQDNSKSDKLRTACFQALNEILNSKDQMTKQKYSLKLKNITNLESVSSCASDQLLEVWEQYTENIGATDNKSKNGPNDLSSLILYIHSKKEIQEVFQNIQDKDSVTHLFFENILKDQLPKFLTKDYIELRNFYNISTEFPFDDEQVKKKSLKETLFCNIECNKFKHIQTFKVDFQSTQLIEIIKLVFQFKIQYIVNQNDSINIRIMTEDLCLGQMVEVISMNLNQEETSQYFQQRNQSELNLPMPPSFQAQYLIIHLTGSILPRLQETQIYPIFLNSWNGLRPFESWLAIAQEPMESNYDAIQKISSNFCKYGKKCKNKKKCPFLHKSRKETSNLIPDTNIITINQKIQDDREKLKNFISKKQDKEIILKLVKRIEKNKNLRHEQADKNISLGYLFFMSEEIAKYYLDNQLCPLKIDENYLNLIETFYLNDSIDNHSNIHLLIKKLQEKVNDATLAYILSKNIEQPRIYQYAKSIKPKDIKEFFKQLINQLGLKLNSFLQQLEDSSIQNYLDEVLVQKLQSQNSKMVFLFKIIEIYSSEIQMEDYISLVIPFLNEVNDTESIFIMIQNFSKLKNNDKVQNDGYNLLMILLKSIQLNTAQFKENNQTLKMMIDIINSKIQLGNLKTALQNLNFIDLERISNFLQFQKLIQDQQIHQTFESILTVIFDQNFKYIKKNKFNNFLVELFTQAIQFEDPKHLQNFIGNIFCMEEIIIEFLMPKLLTVLEFLESQQNIFNLLIFLLKTNSNHIQIKSVFRFILSISCILQTGKKDQDNFKIATSKIPNEMTALNLFDSLLDFLIEHSVSLTDQIEMKSIVSIQLFCYFELAQLQIQPLSDQNNAFKHLIKVFEQEDIVVVRDKVFDKYFSILIFNAMYQNHQVEQQKKLVCLDSILMNLFKLIDNSIYLAIFQDKAKHINQRLYELSEKACIDKDVQFNQGSALQIQLQTKQLFFQLFTQTIKTEEQLHIFLNKMQGFEFLLEQIRQKRYQDEIVVQQSIPKQNINIQRDQQETLNQLIKPLITSLDLQNKPEIDPYRNLGGLQHCRLDQIYKEFIFYCQSKTKLNASEIQVKLNYYSYSNQGIGLQSKYKALFNNLLITCELTDQQQQAFILNKPDQYDQKDITFSYKVPSHDSKNKNSFDIENFLFKKSTIDVSAIKLRFQFYNNFQNSDNFRFAHQNHEQIIVDKVYIKNENQCPPKAFLHYIVENQAHLFLQIFKYLLDDKLSSTIEAVMYKEELLTKIQDNFGIFNHFLQKDLELCKPFILKICIQNQKFCEWFIDQQLLSLEIKKDKFQFLEEIFDQTFNFKVHILLKIQQFIIDQVQKKQEKGFKDKERKKLKKYIKLYLNNINMVTNETSVTLQFTVQDIDSLVMLMSQSQLSFQNRIMAFILQLLNPIKPFENKTIVLQEYAEKLLPSNEDSHILLLSILGCSKQSLLSHILQSGIVEKLITQLSENKSIKIQTLYNLSKQKDFVSQYSSILPEQLFKLSKQMIETLSDQSVKHLTDIIATCCFQCQAQLERIASLIKEEFEGVQQEKAQVNQLSQQSSKIAQTRFIQRFIQQLLQAEEKIRIALNWCSDDNEILPVKIVNSGSALHKSDKNMFPSQILTQQMQCTLKKKFYEISRKHIQNFKNIYEGQWELLYEEKNHQGNFYNRNIELQKIISAIDGKKNAFIIVGCHSIGQKEVFGCFTTLNANKINSFEDQVIKIQSSRADFCFKYNQNEELHFKQFDEQKLMTSEIIFEQRNRKHISFNNDFLFINYVFGYNQQTLGKMNNIYCLEQKSKNIRDQQYFISSIEVWSPSLDSQIQGGNLTFSNSNKFIEVNKKCPLYDKQSPFNYFEANMIFEVSKSLPLEHLAYQIFGQQILFLGNDGKPIETSKQISDICSPSQNITFLNFKILEIEKKILNLPFLKLIHPLQDQFQKINGMKSIIGAAKKQVSSIFDYNIKNMWLTWIEEIQSFSRLPGFLSMLLKNEKCQNILIDMAMQKSDMFTLSSSGTFQQPDSFIGLNSLQSNLYRTQNNDSHQKLNQEIQALTLKVLQEVFQFSSEASRRESFVDSGTLQKIIERLGFLSSEKQRVKQVQNEEKKQDLPQKLIQSSTTIKQSIKPSNQKKGVGYGVSGPGNGQEWDVQKYLKIQEQNNTEAKIIVNLITQFIKTTQWQADQVVKNIFLESAFLPCLEAALRSVSLLEMVKQYDLVISYLQFIQELAINQPSLLPLLDKIGEEYSPKQMESVITLINKIEELASVFLGFINEENKEIEKKEQLEDQSKPRLLAEEIKKTHKIMQAKQSETSHAKEVDSIEDLIKMPLAEAYLKLLTPMKFDKANLKNQQGIYEVRYNGVPVQIDKPVPSKIVRLSQEIADLSKQLPCDHTNAIFCRVDKNRVDVMRFIIMGASETPYAHGAFMYEMHFKNDYPNKPPVCSLCTTGGGQVRFNPNLYANGYICLSILGTWRTNSPSENWDPKLSSILQILLSIQAIVMSNEVYFNEPGYEKEMGTAKGEAQNNGCCNIIRFCNIKYAMIDMIDNPPPGFEKVILANFYLKKNIILREVKKWVDDAPHVIATYNGYVSSHNSQWSALFSIPGKYAQMMQEIYEELRNKLDSLPSPFETQGGQKLERLFSTRGDEKNKLQQISSKLSETKSTLNSIEEEIDVTYDEEAKVHSELNVNDPKVKDRWSRYIGALGIDSVAKQAQSRILICGLGALGIEIAKNITLAGCKELILYDSLKPSKADLSGQFFLTQQDVEEKQHTRAHYSKDKLQQLNLYVKITILNLKSQKDIEGYIQSQGDIKVAVFTEHSMFNREQLHSLNNTCRSKNTAFINTSQTGLFGSCFNDFGNNFSVIDKNGEESEEIMIQSIELNDKGQILVTVLGEQKHKFEDTDIIKFKEVIGMVNNEGKSINDVQQIKIRVINPKSFELLDFDLQKYTKYESGGIAKQIKVPLTLQFKTLQEIDLNANHYEFFDQNLLFADFIKADNIKILHYIEKISLTYPDLKNQGKTLEKIIQALPSDLKEKVTQVEKLVGIYYQTLSTCFPTISAYLGGLVAQQIIVAITQKYSPIKQFYYYDLSELYVDQSIAIEKDKQWNELDLQSSDRYFNLERCIGKKLVESIQSCKIFMIGAGAIGCELLKNYAMLGLGTTGKITLTDPDVIEVSNLNRQFLFREKHLRKPKSQTAAAAAVQMNPNLKGKVEARLDKVCDETIEIYDEIFFKSQSIITNALDNVKARLFIDTQCVQSRTALIDSGTLGPKGHVQIVIPALKTESYASMKDPDENSGEIPQCTLKQFPEENLHCLEWGKSIFDDLFTLKPQNFNKVVVLEKDKQINFSDVQEMQSVKKIIKLIKKMPKSFDQCIEIARLRFQKYFFNNIKQLLHAYPLNQIDKEGKSFWSPPKRIPKPIEYDPINEMHQNIIASLSCLLANMYGIQIPYQQPRAEMAKQNMALKASMFSVPQFVPSEEKTAQIQAAVQNSSKSKGEKDEVESQIIDQPEESKQNCHNNIDIFINQFKSIVEPIRQNQSIKLQVEEFEKDKDENFHIDFIHAMTNVRATNYKLDEMDWITVKIKAGKIIPALATTTAAIAALQTIEIIRFLKNSKLEEYKQTFLNLSVPILGISEPALAHKIKLGSSGIEVSLWDRWEYKASVREVTLLEILEHLESSYKLQVSDILYEGMSLYMSIDYETLEERNDSLCSIFLLEQTHQDSEQKDFITHIDLTVTFVEPAKLIPKQESLMMIDTSSAAKEKDNKILEGTPVVRVYLPKEK